MTFETILLVSAAIVLMASLAAPSEGLLLGAVALYTGALLWLIRMDLGLILPGLGIASVFGGLAVWRMLRRGLPDEDVTNCHSRHNSTKVVTTNASMMGE